MGRAFLSALVILAWFAPQVAAQEKPLWMLDFIFLNDGATLTDRDAYNAKAQPVAARHGVVLQVTLDTRLMMIGPPELDRVDLWTLPGPQALNAWGQDPEYKEMLPEALRVHDMNQLTLYLGREVSAPQITAGAFYYLELFAFHPESFAAQDFIDYVHATDALAQEFGLARVASMSNLQKALGPGPETHWFNLYSVPSEAAFKAWNNDQRFKDLAPTRNRLLNLNNSVLAIMQAQ